MSRSDNGTTDALSNTAFLFTKWLFQTSTTELARIIKEGEKSYLDTYEKLTKPLGEPSSLNLLNQHEWASASFSDKSAHFMARMRNGFVVGATVIAKSIFSNRLEVLQKDFPGGATAENVLKYIKHPSFSDSGSETRAVVLRYSLKDHCFGLLFKEFLEKCEKDGTYQKDSSVAIIINSYKGYNNTNKTFDPFYRARDIYNMFMASYTACSALVKSNPEAFGMSSSGSVTAANFLRVSSLDAKDGDHSLEGATGSRSKAMHSSNNQNSLFGNSRQHGKNNTASVSDNQRARTMGMGGNDDGD